MNAKEGGGQHVGFKRKHLKNKWIFLCYQNFGGTFSSFNFSSFFNYFSSIQVDEDATLPADEPIAAIVVVLPARNVNPFICLK